MDFKLAKLDGVEILNGSTTGIYYASKEWRQLTTDDTSINSAGYHGRRTSATFARKRVVTLEGLIQRFDNPNEQSAVEHLQNLLCLQSNTGTVEPRTLYIKDMYDQEWTLPVKVREPATFIEYSDDWKGAYWKWMAVLESIESPIYKGNTEDINTGTEGTIGGFNL